MNKRHIIIACLVCILCVLSGCGQAITDDISENAAQVAQDAVDSLYGATLSLPEFSDIDIRTLMEGKKLEDYTQEELATLTAEEARIMVAVNYGASYRSFFQMKDDFTPTEEDWIKIRGLIYCNFYKSFYYTYPDGTKIEVYPVSEIAEPYYELARRQTTVYNDQNLKSQLYMIYPGITAGDISGLSMKSFKILLIQFYLIPCTTQDEKQEVIDTVEAMTEDELARMKEMFVWGMTPVYETSAPVLENAISDNTASDNMNIQKIL